jgi:RND superfamily putative drug exporter
MNLSTEGLARASSRRPWVTIGVWVLLLAAAGLIASQLLGGALTTQADFTNKPEGKRAQELLEDRLRGPRRVNEIIIVRSETLTVDDPAFRAYVEGLYQQVVGLGNAVVESGVNYYQVGSPMLVSADRHTTIMPFVMAGTIDEASDNIKPVIEVVKGANGRDGFQALIAGGASVGEDFTKIAEKDLLVGEMFGGVAALVILALVFAAVVAALIPLALAIIAIAIALGLTALLGQVFEFSFFVTNMITMMGLAVGIDYSLFIISRYREERARGREKLDAIARAGATASRAVFFSGMTVVLALLGMLIVPTTIFRSLASGAILVVVVAVLASLTLLPALLSLIGDRVNALRVPILGRRLVSQRAEGSGGFWDWMTRNVMRRPVISLAVTAGLLIAAAVPYFSINTGFAGVSTLPDSADTKDAFVLLEREFSFGLLSPAEVVIDGDISSQPVRDGISRLEAALKADPGFVGQPSLQVNPSGDLALLSMPMAAEANSEVAIQAIKRLRSQHVPQAFAGVANAEALVTGDTALNIDFFDLTDQYTPIVFAFVLGLSFILLTIVFRSIVIPVKAIIMNLLSVGAAYGLMVLVTQKGVGAGILGFQQVDTVEAWIPLFLFSVLFGLSMDYHVFLLSRIRERYDQTLDNTGSVAFGLRSTAGIITGAALIMVAVFGGFASGELVMFQQVGFGLAVAVFLDATIVRSVLVPASMKLLGKVNWYLPGFLSWLPDVRVEGDELASRPAPAAGSSRAASPAGD